MIAKTVPVEEKIKWVIDRLVGLQCTIAFAESVTGGYLAHKFAITEGSGKVFLGSLICYHPALKEKMLDVPAELIAQCTAESADVTVKMVEGLMKTVRPDIGVAITGLCSPGGSESDAKPVGTIFVAISFKGQIYSKRYLNKGQPKEIVHKAVEEIADELFRLLA